jgi:flagellar biosynthesis protein FlhF
VLASARSAQTQAQASPNQSSALNVSAANSAYGGNQTQTQSATKPQTEGSTQVTSTTSTSVTSNQPVKEAETNKSDRVDSLVDAPDETEVKSDSKKADDSVLSEIRQMKEMMIKLSTVARGDGPQHPESIQAMIDLMEAQEFDSTLIEEIIFHVKSELEAAGITEPDEQQVQALVRTQLEKIVYSNGVETISPDTKIVHFVGPTGVGKTTTIAKLAALQVLDNKRKVGFITADTYRIAAVEQLRTYASILNAPIEVAMSPQDLARAYESMKDLDIIFMDTAGRNFRNEMYVSELNTMLNSSDQSETYLVLSMTMKYKDMKAITENFSRIRIDRLLFSKMDETASYGAIINLIHQFSIPLSYFTHGQQVPNDIEVVKKDQFIDRLMGEESDE